MAQQGLRLAARFFGLSSSKFLWQVGWLRFCSSESDDVRTLYCTRWVCCCSCQCSDVVMPRTLLVPVHSLANSVCSIICLRHAGESCCRRERHMVICWHGRLESFPLVAACAMLRGQDQPRWHRDGRTYCLQLTLLNLSLQVPLSCYIERS